MKQQSKLWFPYQVLLTLIALAIPFYVLYRIVSRIEEPMTIEKDLILFIPIGLLLLNYGLAGLLLSFHYYYAPLLSPKFIAKAKGLSILRIIVVYAVSFLPSFAFFVYSGLCFCASESPAPGIVLAAIGVALLVVGNYYQALLLVRWMEAKQKAEKANSR